MLYIYIQGSYSKLDKFQGLFKDFPVPKYFFQDHSSIMK